MHYFKGSNAFIVSGGAISSFLACLAYLCSGLASSAAPARERLPPVGQGFGQTIRYDHTNQTEAKPITGGKSDSLLTAQEQLTVWESMIDKAERDAHAGDLKAVEKGLRSACEYAIQCFGRTSIVHVVSSAKLASFYRDVQDFPAAEKHCREALLLLDSVDTGRDKYVFQTTLIQLESQISNGRLWKSYYDTAKQLITKGEWERAETTGQVALVLAEQYHGTNDVATAESLSLLAIVNAHARKWKQASELTMQVLTVYSNLYGADSESAHFHLVEYCTLLNEANRHADVVAILDWIAAPNDKRRVEPKLEMQMLHLLSLAYAAQQKRAEALGTLRKLRQCVIKAHGSNTVETAAIDYALATAANNAGDLTQADASCREGLHILEKLGQTNGAEYGMLLQSQAVISKRKQDQAWTVLQKGIELSEKMRAAPLTLTDDDVGRDGWTVLVFAARTRALAGKHDEAELLFKRAVNIASKALPASDVQLADLYKEYGVELGYQKKYTEAEQTLQRSLDILRLPHQTNQLALARSLATLAVLQLETGRYSQGEALLKEALDIISQEPEAELDDFSNMFQASGWLAANTGNHERARSLLGASLFLEEQKWGTNSLRLVSTLTGLAAAEMRNDNWFGAEAYCRRALAISKAQSKAWSNFIGSINPPARAEIIDALSSLGAVFAQGGKYDEAREIFSEAIELGEAGFGPNHLVTVPAQHGMACLIMKADGNTTLAEQMMRQALAVREKWLPPGHPELVSLIWDLALCKMVQGNAREALELYCRANQMEDMLTREIFSFSSESERVAFRESTEVHQDEFLSFCLDTLGSAGAETALNYLLRRKGIVLDSMIEDVHAVQQSADPDCRDILRQLRSLKSRIAQIVMSKPNVDKLESSQSEVERLTREAELLEKDLARKSARFRAGQAATQIGLTNILDAMEPGTALVEYVKYFRIGFELGSSNVPVDSRRFKYAAIVLEKDEANPVAIDLGDATGIEGLIEWHRDMLERLVSQHTSVVPLIRKSAMALEHAVWSPVKVRLRKAKRIYISPDGELNFVSFAGLCDKSGRFVLEDYDLSYVSSGRDLLRQPLPRAGTDKEGGAVVFAAPDYGGQPTLQEALPITRSAAFRSELADVRSFGGHRFGPLPQTKVEAGAIRELFGGHGAQVAVYVDEAASEARVKGTEGPRVLHFATHGFFLPDTGWDREGDESKTSRLENPMHRSGLALAGANRTLEGLAPAAGGEDGLLTAEEVAGLELGGTELVVLSACESGLGEAKAGEGVLGLRRAFVRAGAENLVLALWKVDDEAARRLMTGFYKRRLGGQAVWRALLEAQREMVVQERTAGREPNPFYWAPFVASGIGVQ
ncbi:MAG TPA: CHAT domain-containing protein [Candidatus Paceibacterota bacterium]|nr:CHAT domain-containing protein [Verrucomicrobiota bacterium]HRZ45279.1 CHAT domain-containing protein [Candidatus Paceibacterota bacterium]HRZ99289.1 CHAT domain-containing protein [Candidatus Paceibacterota bacterium]